MRRVLNRRFVYKAVLYSPELGLIYLNNAKAGCSTIKSSLGSELARRKGIPSSDKLHRRPIDPFVQDLFAEDNAALRVAVMFSVVRNPFVRTLSAYLNKIGKRNNGTWKSFCDRFQLNVSLTRRDLSFSQFLKIIAEEPDELLDRHFAPQYINLLLPFSSPRFIGRVEAMTDVAAFLAKFQIPLESRRGHTTGARDQVIAAYSPENVECVQTKYADDFRLFGYSTDIRGITDYESPFIESHSKDLLIDWLVTGRMPLDHLDPAQQAFEAFKAEGDPEKKLLCIQSQIVSEDNWSRLEAYARFVQSIGDNRTLRLIVDRILTLKTRHLAHASCPRSFFRENPYWTEFAQP